MLATIASPALQSRLTQERATLSSLQSELGRHEIASRQARVKTKQELDVLAVRHEAAGRALRRTRSLGEQGVVPVSEIEKAQDDLEIAALELKNRRETATLERETQSFEGKTRRLDADRQRSVVGELERQTGALEIAAPFDGIVAAVSVQDRDAVAENQPLMTVVNLTALEVELELAENQAADVGPGTAVEVAYGGRKAGRQGGGHRPRGPRQPGARHRRVRRAAAARAAPERARVGAPAARSPRAGA